jgi:hypothetical protein
MKVLRKGLLVVAVLAGLFGAFVLRRVGPRNVIGMIRYVGANALYAGWPERFYIVDERGVIVYKGKPGPFGYHPEEVESWLARRFPTPPG